eukprot:TRINITY_DN13143_c1_g3_i1.p1 TRINITY_DN13143_c1_g3~~TRINITY_DN13143_c1_g3_i1.p1  ORF type:complete len:404 (-),score=98.26 TRINITY_DN13143_c1_g3_i1:171-1289(-)
MSQTSSQEHRDSEKKSKIVAISGSSSTSTPTATVQKSKSSSSSSSSSDSSSSSSSSSSSGKSSSNSCGKKKAEKGKTRTDTQTSLSKADATGTTEKPPEIQQQNKKKRRHSKTKDVHTRPYKHHPSIEAQPFCPGGASLLKRPRRAAASYGCGEKWKPVDFDVSRVCLQEPIHISKIGSWMERNPKTLHEVNLLLRRQFQDEEAHMDQLVDEVDWFFILRLNGGSGAICGFRTLKWQGHLNSWELENGCVYPPGNGLGSEFIAAIHAWLKHSYPSSENHNLYVRVSDDNIANLRLYSAAELPLGSGVKFVEVPFAEASKLDPELDEGFRAFYCPRPPKPKRTRLSHAEPIANAEMEAVTKLFGDSDEEEVKF